MTITQTKPNKIINPENANVIIEVADEIIFSNYEPGVEFKLKVQPLTLGGFIAVLVVQNKEGADVYNYHPLRVGFQKVYSLQKLKNLNDAVQSGVEALLRLHE